MSLVLVLLSIVMTYFTPGEVAPALAKFHLQQFILIPAFLTTLLAISTGQARMHSPQFQLAVGFWIAVIVSQLARVWFGGAFIASYVFGLVVGVYFLTALNTFTLSRIKIVCATLTATAVIECWQSVGAYFAGDPTSKLLNQGRIQGRGIISDPKDFAQFLLVGMCCLGVFWKKKSLLPNVFLIPPAAFLMVGIYLTYSRGAVIGLIAIAYAVLSTKVAKPLCVTVAALLLVILIAAGFGGGRDYSMQEGSAAGRIIAWGDGISDLKSHPLFGRGYNSFIDNHLMTAHNSFVLCFAELGFFGYFFWMALVLMTFIGLERAGKIAVDRKDDAYGGVVNALRAAFYAFLGTAWFLSRTYNETLFLLFALCGSAIHMHASLPEVKKMLEQLRRTVLRRTFAYQLLSVVVIYLTVRIRTM